MIKELANRAIQIIFRRRQAYRALFNIEQSAAQIVLADLRRFCRATSTPAMVSAVTQRMDPMATGVAIGRLEVWHRIAQNIHLSDADLYRMVEQQENSHE